MIITVYSLADFEERADLSQDIYYSWETQNVGSHLPRIEITTKAYGLVKGRDSLIIYERLETVSVDDVKNASDLLRGISEVTRARISCFEDEIRLLAESHKCRAIPGSMNPSPITDALAPMLSKILESLDKRVRRLETKELDEVDERLCRLESEILPSVSRVGEVKEGDSWYEVRRRMRRGNSELIIGS